jgi:hypothetical protein
MYGNYMEFPPVEERGKRHSIFFDPDRPYSDYEGKLTKEDIRKGLDEY